MFESFPPPAFEGFAPGALGFFDDLAAHQDRAWFAEHRHIYEDAVQRPLGSLVTDLSAELARRGVSLRGDAKRSVLRLNRDVRFSGDKRPYKTNAGAVLSRTGEKKSPGILYLQLGPAHAFAAAGFYQGEPDTLRRFRDRLVARPADWAKVETSLAANGLALQREGGLIRLPKGYDAVPPAVETAIKLKSWIVIRELVPAALHDAGLVQTLAGFATAALPLLEFGWLALDRPVQER